MKISKFSKALHGLPSTALAIFVALTVRWGVAEAYEIPSGSMLPTLLIHDHIFVNKLIYGIRVPFSKIWLAHFRDPERGEIVVFKDPRDESINLIKRIVGIPGDKIEYHQNVLYINDQIVETPAVEHTAEFNQTPDVEFENQKPDHIEYLEKLGNHPHSVLHRKDEFDREVGPIQVPEGTFFAMGDHRDNSADSRFWGFAPQANILGRATYVWLSCDESLPGTNFGCNPLTIRWRRFFHWVD